MSVVAEAWQAALATEHQAVFGYALLGPRLEGDDRARAESCARAHDTVRDDSEAALAAAGVTPPGPRADYPALFPVADAAGARRLAVRLEDDTASAWRALYASAASAATASDVDARRARSDAQRYLTAAAVRAARWRMVVDAGRATTPFPGI